MATWPSEHLPRPSPFEMDPGRVFVYFLSPSASQFDLVETYLRTALDSASSRFGLSHQLERAITSNSPVIVHDDIWNWLYNADLLVFDVTDENASVMMELGVAAGWRLKPQVIVLQNKDRGQARLPFNLSPARVLRYDLSPAGLRRLQRGAQEAFEWSFSSLPVADASRFPRTPVFPFGYPQNAADLITPPLSHRHQRPDGSLVFGAPHEFRYSFAMPNTGPRSAMRLVAEMSFGERLPAADPGSGWIGFKLLGSGVLMNHGVGAVVRPNGAIQLTYQEGERGPYRDPTLPRPLARFNADQDRVRFEASVQRHLFSVRISTRRGEVRHRLDLVNKARYRPSAGVCLLQAYRCRGIIHRVSIT